MALFLLRVTQIGLRMDDLDVLEYGEIIDMCIEAQNDHADYDKRATQEDFDRF